MGQFLLVQLLVQLQLLEQQELWLLVAVLWLGLLLLVELLRLLSQEDWQGRLWVDLLEPSCSASRKMWRCPRRMEQLSKWASSKLVTKYSPSWILMVNLPPIRL